MQVIGNAIHAYYNTGDELCSKQPIFLETYLLSSLIYVYRVAPGYNVFNRDNW